MTKRYIFKFMEKNFQLPNARLRTRLIEILLIIGAIIAAFDKSPPTIILFSVFVLLSIWYYIFVQKEEENFSYICTLSLFVSLSFISIIIYNMLIALCKMFLEESNEFLKVLYPAAMGLIIVVYLPFFVLILYNALKPSK